jgi:hypothetical protein
MAEILKRILVRIACSGLVAGIAVVGLASSSSASGQQLTATPLPAALPLFATGLGALGLLGWRRKRKAQAA